MDDSLQKKIQGLPWLKSYQIPGCPEDVIMVDFRRPDFKKPVILRENVWVRIDSIEGHVFRCTVVRQPRMDWKINKGDPILVEYYFFENAHWFSCVTVEEKFGFEWL